MKDSLFRIGEMAAMNHVSTQTLRLYAKIKLLEPEYLDPETGYRYYTLEQCAKLDLIRALKSCCLPLERIREYWSFPPNSFSCRLWKNRPQLWGMRYTACPSAAAAFSASSETCRF